MDLSRDLAQLPELPQVDSKAAEEIARLIGTTPDVVHVAAARSTGLPLANRGELERLLPPGEETDRG